MVVVTEELGVILFKKACYNNRGNLYFLCAIIGFEHYITMN